MEINVLVGEKMKCECGSEEFTLKSVVVIYDYLSYKNGETCIELGEFTGEFDVNDVKEVICSRCGKGYSKGKWFEDFIKELGEKIEKREVKIL